MDWLTFGASAIGSLAWPVAALIVLMLLKEPITTMFPLLKRLKAGPVEAEFERAVQQIEREVSAELPNRPEFLPQLMGERRHPFLQIAATNPRAAILAAWQEVEFATKRAALQNLFGSPAPDLSTPHKVIRALEQAGLISPEDLDVYNKLRGLRNQAAHSADFNPSYESAAGYIEVAFLLKTKFDSLADPAARA